MKLLSGLIIGFIIGILGGFFGVGGSFIAGPALRLVGIDWNFAVGTDLAHIVGKSVVAAKRHRALGNVDLRLGLIMAIGTIAAAWATWRIAGRDLVGISTRGTTVKFASSSFAAACGIAAAYLYVLMHAAL